MEQLGYNINSMDTEISEKYMVCACSDGIVRICTFINEKITPVADLVGHKSQVTKAVYINQGELLASSDFTGNLIIWKLEKSAYQKKAENQVINGGIYDIAGRMVNNMLEIFCACDGGVVKKVVFDSEFNATETTKEVHKYGTTCISCNSDFVLSGGVDFSVVLQGKETVKYFNTHLSAINSVALAPSNAINKTVFASCSEDGVLIIYQGRGDEIKEQEIKLKEPAHSLSWNKTGFVLTVGYGDSGFKSYILGEDGDNFVEVEMKQVS